MEDISRRRGIALYHRNLWEAAYEEFSLALKRAQGRQDREMEVRNLGSLWAVEQSRGRLRAAQALAEQALCLAPRCSSRVRAQSLLNGLVSAAQRGAFGAALELSQELDGLCAREALEPGLLGRVRLSQTGLLIETRRYREAWTRALEAEALLGRTGDPLLKAFSLLHLGILHLRERRFGVALAHLDRALVLAQDRAGPAELAHILTEQAWAYLGLGLGAEALESAFGAAWRLLHNPASLDWPELGRVYLVLGALLSALGEHNLAARLAADGAAWLAAHGRAGEAEAVACRADQVALRVGEETLEAALVGTAYLRAVLERLAAGPDGADGHPYPRRLAQGALLTSPALAEDAETTVLQYAALVRYAGLPAPPPPLAPVWEAALAALSEWDEGPSCRSCLEARVLAVLDPYLQATYTGTSYIDALNDLARRAGEALDWELVLRLCAEHLLEEERG